MAAKLSNNVLEMKFMKKTKEKCEKEAEEERRKNLFDSEIPEHLIKGGDLCIMEPSFVPCLQLLNGRFSYRGMNPEIEKLMEENNLKNLDKLKQMDGISAKEMADRYSTLVDSMQKKFTTKRKWTEQNKNKNEDEDVVICSSSYKTNNKRFKFRKPIDT
ncbi:M-phase phosphoprotein 6 [Parasteatoda tepidariorum]|uniref:M-phase phosphoprotein 6 n=1 Tax=Parasteatoda tepidariorum TaxID=114398 RepID=UPI001C71F7F0|nr:M-phase phosphoprotein 6 [Parasteatoda tepidariorum]